MGGGAQHDADAAGELLLSQLQLPHDEAIQEIFEHCDSDGTGTLDHGQFCSFFSLVSTEPVELSKLEFSEVCLALGGDPGTGVRRGMFDGFFEGMDGGRLRTLLLEVQSSE